ncbi:hypothetical protein KL918_001826 [Ogataea parapolymorpha]|uniref:Protein SQS1 n=1 Tax=Ogataea parapolymorpha (strain ATCC 26012 / BCRC 20466 / JCM 22074 / NRRL Y-7560 / DL-1) TaxID=871575 RepID=W1QFU7_OGAPD|nr:Protein SQS1 [Ogataea parapolymorpha DL-1]ESW98783.1 Protein SQS1 [Ogataea parapolymorpha DL-1]KAG7868168.1 hypothetical protein KL918_001826 [Ogataea parapolymorpha]KAG7874212.1 hypothetical protein KL916_001552 [Ogataea parapolymorpha]
MAKKGHRAQRSARRGRGGRGGRQGTRQGTRPAPVVRRGRSHGEFIELMDLQAGHMVREVEFTGRHREETLKRPLRKLPMEFVKACEVYDPRQLLKGVRGMHLEGETEETEETEEEGEELIEGSEEEEEEGEKEGEKLGEESEGQLEEEEPAELGELDESEQEQELDNENYQNIPHDPHYPHIPPHETHGELPESDDEGEELYNIDNDEGSFIESDASASDVSSREGPLPFGYDADDYAFNVNLLRIDNVRYGAATTQYYAHCAFLDDEMQWFDKEDLADLLVDQGLPEHRVDAFFEYATEHLREPEQPLEPVSSDDDSDGSGVDEMVAFYSSRVINDPIELEVPTASLQTTGKGRKKRLVLDEDMDEDLRQTLLESFSKRHRSKEKPRSVSNGTGELLAKYPFEVHVRDMKHEYDLFYHDAGRETLQWPPLDPHGLRTLRKLAECYNLKPRSLGNGPKTHLVAIKTKHTYKRVPNYSQVARILKQRPIFRRTDVHLSKDEIMELKNKRKKSSKEHGQGRKWAPREGDVVAATAPEISADNVGRQLLEKMGWQKGSALGKTNSGIIEPIQATVKLTKQGIGSAHTQK